MRTWVGNDCDQLRHTGMQSSQSQGKPCVLFPVPVIFLLGLSVMPCMSGWIQSSSMMIIITINIVSFGLGISQKREEPPINQNRKKVKRRSFFVHPIIQNRTTHTHAIIPGSIVYRKPNPSQFLLLFPERGREEEKKRENNYDPLSGSNPTKSSGDS